MRQRRVEDRERHMRHVLQKTRANQGSNRSSKYFQESIKFIEAVFCPKRQKQLLQPIYFQVLNLVLNFYAL